MAASGVRGHFFGQSSFATHTLATGRNLVKIGTSLPLDVNRAIADAKSGDTIKPVLRISPSNKLS